MMQPHRPFCVATGRFGIGLLLSNAVDSRPAAQLFRTRERREHIPVGIEIEVPLRGRPLSDPRIKIDRSEPMRCVTKGTKRQEFFDCLEGDVPEGKWKEAEQAPCSDEAWQFTCEVATKALQKVCPEGKKRWPEWPQEAREWRMHLLDRRRDLRERAGEEFESVQVLL